MGRVAVAAACLSGSYAAAARLLHLLLPAMQVFLTQQYLAIAMEYAAGGDMFEHVVRKGGLKESEARWFFQQLIVGVDYVHRMVRVGSRAAGLGVQHVHGHMWHCAVYLGQQSGVSAAECCLCLPAGCLSLALHQISLHEPAAL